MPLLLFRHTTNYSLYVVRDSQTLLYHSRVTPLDVFLGRCGLEMVGNLAALAFSFLILYVLGAVAMPNDPFLFIIGNLYMAWWSISVALVVSAWSERTEIVAHIWQPISYIYMPVSGFFFLAAWLPTPVRNLALTVMPSLHAYEMIRGGLLGPRIQTFYDVGYLSTVLAFLTIFGLWLMRDVRRFVGTN